MPNYPTHRNTGIATGVVGAGLAYWQVGFTPVEAGAAVVVGAICGLLPDLDHPEAKPGSLLRTVVVYLIPVLLFMYLPRHVVADFTIGHWILIFAGSHVILGQLLLWLIDLASDHRGLFHSFPASILCGEVAYFVFYYLPPHKRLAFALVAFAGYLTHLVMDEIYSLDMDKGKIKRSFGTAIDLGDFRSLWTWLLYAIVVSLLVLGVYEIKF